MNFADRKESSKANNTLALSNYLFLEHNTNILKSQLSKHQNSKQIIKTKISSTDIIKFLNVYDWQKYTLKSCSNNKISSSYTHE